MAECFVSGISLVNLRNKLSWLCGLFYFFIIAKFARVPFRRPLVPLFLRWKARGNESFAGLKIRLVRCRCEDLFKRCLLLRCPKDSRGNSRRKTKKRRQMLDAKTLNLKSVGKVYQNLSFDELFEHESRNNEGKISENGTMMIDTGKFTGRSPRISILSSRLPRLTILPGVTLTSLSPRKFLTSCMLTSSIILPEKIFM